MSVEDGIRSWVLRAGRMTAGQRTAIERHWSKFGIGPPPGPRVPSSGGRVIEPAAEFGRSAPLVVEVGFGRGDSLLKAASERPDRDYIGIEVHAPGIGYLLSRIHAQGIGNVRVLFGDARASLRERFPERSIEELWIYFPDPWPKKRHHKRRLVQAGFVATAARCLRPGGRIRAATDHEEYGHHMLTELEAEPTLRNLAGTGAFWSGPIDRPASRFAERGLRQGNTVLDLAFERRPAS